MGYYAKTGIGLAMMAAGLAVAAYCIYELASFGTCASGGPYVSARECPAGTGTLIAGIFPSILVVLLGAWMFSARGGRATAPGLPPTATTNTRS